MAAGRRSASAGRRCTESGVQADSSVAHTAIVCIMPVTCGLALGSMVNVDHRRAADDGPATAPRPSDDP